MAPVVTRPGGTPPGVIPQSPVTKSSTPTPVVTSIPTNIMPQVGVIISSQQSLAPISGVMGITLAVAAGGALVTPQTGMLSSASQGQSVVNTSITPSGSNQPVSHPIVIEPSRLRPPTGVMVGVEGLTLPSDPQAMITATVARLVTPVGSQTSLQGLASHQAAVATSQVGMDTSSTVIGTIHGPGLLGPITVAGGSTEPKISVLPSCEKGSQVFMVVEDDNVVEVGGLTGSLESLSLREKGQIPLPFHLMPPEGEG